MSKVRLLFAPESVALADRIATALIASGHAVAAGEEPAAVSLVMWSPAASKAPAILSAARAALARRVLVPVALGKAPPPASFEHLWPMDLSGWSGAVDDPRWRFVLDEIDLAARRDVEIALAPEVKNAASPQQPAPKPGARRQSAAVAAEEAFEDMFEEPLTYVVAARPRPRIPFAALVAGVAVLGVATGGAFIAGRSMTGAPTAPVAEKPAPVIAFVQPKDQPADDTDLDEPDHSLAVASQPAEPETATAEEDEEFPSGEGDADFPGDSVASASAVSEFLRDGALPPPPDAAATPQKAPEAASAAGDDATNTAAANPDIDRIAGLAWNATTEVDPPALGSYLRDCLDCPDMAEIEPGVLTPDVTEDDLAPPVMLRRRIAFAVRETTFDEWAACVAAGACAPLSDNGWGKGKRPAVNVSWSEAQTYARWLSEKTGLAYRLPTETEWEYAARGGSPTAFSFGPAVAADKANFDAARPYGGPVGVARGRTLPTASFAPNGFGLYDMHGNVAEWTADCWSGDIEGVITAASGGLCSARVVKGGAWNDGGADLRASARKGVPQTESRYDLGFRVVRDVR